MHKTNGQSNETFYKATLKFIHKMCPTSSTLLAVLWVFYELLLTLPCSVNFYRIGLTVVYFDLQQVLCIPFRGRKNASSHFSHFFPFFASFLREKREKIRQKEEIMFIPKSWRTTNCWSSTLEVW